ncbi:MAG: synthase, large subunit [Rickettsiaceae bacterium]|jgi:GMP synthase (glutamine-hydrolysing)|nr:synthase, large subunit [Rickettsiaceae bacterium]
MILIIDFGSQVTQLIARRIRELNVYSEIKNPGISLDEIKKLNPKAIILSGGPESVYEKDAPTIDKGIFDLGIPVLGICYGQQLICHLLGGKVESSANREFGKAIIYMNADELDEAKNKNLKLFVGIDGISDFANVGSGNEHLALISSNRPRCQVWMSHGDYISKIPDGFEGIAETPDCPYAAIADKKRRIYGIQFHPEVTHTIEGSKILKNFVVNIAGCEQSWTMGNFMEEQIVEIKAKVGNKKVICGLSGGVDSSVVAALISKAIGNQLTCIFVDHGLLRKDEGKNVKEVFEDHFKVNLVYVDAAKIFLQKLKDITDPEQKRKIIGKTFIEIFDEEAAKIKDVEFLAQGTLYPDVIESSHPNSGKSHTIKSHHNVGGLPKDMKLKLIEPIRTLFKDEVRKLGTELGLTYGMISRHPFPGPGLAIRIPGEVTLEKIKILQEADAIYLDEIRKFGLYDKIWQAFCVLLPVKTVGVMGDGRTYEYVLALRAVTSSDGMTADIFQFSYDFLTSATNRIIGEVRGINRVVYDVTSKPPGTIEWE